MTLSRRLRTLERAANTVREFDLTALSYAEVGILLAVLEAEECRPGATTQESVERVVAAFAEHGLAILGDWVGPIRVGGRMMVLKTAPLIADGSRADAAGG